MTDTVTESTVWPVNANGEIVATNGEGDDTVVAYLPTSLVPLTDGRVAIKFAETEPVSWNSASLQNDWENVDTFITTAYRLVDDAVQIRMSVIDGTSNVIFTLPEELYPLSNMLIPITVLDSNEDPVVGNLLINTSGEVSVEGVVLAGHSVFGTFSYWVS